MISLARQAADHVLVSDVQMRGEILARDARHDHVQM
jgi:hypothetical protein